MMIAIRNDVAYLPNPLKDRSPIKLSDFFTNSKLGSDALVVSVSVSLIH